MKKLVKWGAAVAASVVSVAAFADVPAAVTTALTGAGTDSVTVAGSVIAIIVGIAAFQYMRRALR